MEYLIKNKEVKIKNLKKVLKAIQEKPLKNFWTVWIEEITNLTWVRIYLKKNEYIRNELCINTQEIEESGYIKKNAFTYIYFKDLKDIETEIKETIKSQEEQLKKIKKSIKDRKIIKNTYNQVIDLLESLDKYDYKIKNKIKKDTKNNYLLN